MVQHVRFESLYIPLPSSELTEKQQSPTYFGERVPKWVIYPDLLRLPFELNAVITYLA